MIPVIKWMFLLVLAAVPIVTIVTIMINQTMELERIPEDEKLTDITSAGYLMAHYNSVSVWNSIYYKKIIQTIIKHIMWT
jgi:glutamyl aminopeptidase